MGVEVMALETVMCPDCYASGEILDWPCPRCMGAGELEVQRGPQDQDYQVPDRPYPGKLGPNLARRLAERDQQGEV